MSQSGVAAVGAYVARDGESRPVEIAYDVIGDRGRPLVLVMGIGAQRIFWDDRFCQLLVDAGFQVVRFDHRDVGESTRLDAAVPRPLRVLGRRLVGLPVTAPYSLSDMAGDVVGLLDALGLASAHVVGVSLGGMICQHLAIEHAARVRSATSIMSTPGARRFVPSLSAFRALLAPAPRTPDQAADHVEHLFTTIGSTAWPVDRARLRGLGAQAFERGSNPRGFLRQLAAVAASGDRTERLREVRVPLLVIHGTRDPMFPLSAGRTTARVVRGATWLPIAGMGHDLPAPMWPTLVSAIAAHADRAER